MSATDDLLANNEAYAASFDKADSAAAAGQEGRSWSRAWTPA